MKFTFFRFILLFSLIVLLSSCLGSSNNTVVTSSDASIVSLVFAQNDSIPNLNTAVFTLDADGQTITNVDSLPFKTRVDSVNPTFGFTSSAGAKLYFPAGYKYKKDSAFLTGKDTLDFRQPIRIKNYASDNKTFKIYTVKVNVHQVNPEKYVWNKVSDNLNSINATSQKAVTLNNRLFYYLNDGTSSYLSVSNDGYSWKDTTIVGLPTGAPLGDMTQFNGKLYLTQDGFNIYSSANGANWTKKSASDFTFKSLLFVLNGKIWAVVQSKTDLSFHFANSVDGDIWNMIGAIPANFPVRDFASVSFASPTGKARVLVLGGYSADGKPLNNRWSTESTEDNAYWIDFSTENHTLDTLAVGSSVISYDSKLFVFGSRTDNGKNYYKVSKDEGLSWQMPDTANVIPANFVPRSYQSAIVFKPKTYDKINSVVLKDEILKSNRIFIVGGKMGSVNFSDVWTGKLNRKNFLRQ
jgi:hypothetical protein